MPFDREDIAILRKLIAGFSHSSEPEKSQSRERAGERALVQTVQRNAPIDRQYDAPAILD